MADSKWEDSLIHLHEMGWDMDDIDAACEVLFEACSEGEFEGLEPSELSPEQLVQLLGDEVEASERDALVRLAGTRSQEDPEAEALREALWDIDEFADNR